MKQSRWFAVLIVLIVAADWGSKLWIRNRLPIGEAVSVVDGWVWFTHRLNRGVAFSMFADLSDAWRTPLLVVMALVALGVLASVIRSTSDPWIRWAGALVSAGALANLGDRVLDGAVTDFILLRYFPAVFNVADVAITVGGLMLFRMLAVGERTPTS